MSKDHDGDYRGFSHLRRAWYGPQLKTERYVDEVMFGYYCPDGGTSGETGMRWYDLNGDKPTPRLEVYCDAWHALAQFGDLLAALAEADGKDVEPDAFCRLLVRLGFEDRTPVDDEKREQLEQAIRKATVETVASLT